MSIHSDSSFLVLDLKDGTLAANLNEASGADRAQQMTGSDRWAEMHQTFNVEDGGKWSGECRVELGCVVVKDWRCHARFRATHFPVDNDFNISVLSCSIQGLLHHRRVQAGDSQDW